MKRIGAALLAAAAALLLLRANPLAAQPAPGAPIHIHDARLSLLLDRTVQDPNAQALGTVKDFVLARSSAQAEYVIIQSGGVLGLGSRSRALPITRVSSATIVRDILSTGVTKQQWRHFPPFDGEVAALSAPPPPPRTPTGPLKVSAHVGSDRLLLASKLLGATVVNRNHEKLGTVTDMLLDLDQQRPALVIIRYARFLHRSQTFAVSLLLLSHTQGNELLLDTSLPRLEQAPVFSEESWDDAATQGRHAIYRVPGFAET